MVIGDIGTGRGSALMLKEEPSFAGAIASGTATWFRRRRHNFQKIPSMVQTNHAGANKSGFSKVAVYSTIGMMDFELDMTSIGRLLKGFMGSMTNTQQGGTSEYKHVFKFGDTLKTYRVYENKGGLSTPYYRDSTGMFPNRISLNVDTNDTVWGSVGFIGKTNASGTNPGTPAPAADNLTVGFRNVTFKVGTAGETAIGNLTAWTDPYDMRLDLSRPDAKADSYLSDGTGLTSGIFEGTPTVSCNLMAQFTTNHNLAAYEADTEKAFGVVLDTGVAIPSGNGSNYKMEIVMPRVKFKTYSIDVNGQGTILPVIDLEVMTDPTATYDIEIDLYNNTAAYADST